MAFGRFVRVEAIAVGSYRMNVTPVYSVMRYVNSEPASSDVHISSDRERWVASGWHKMR